ncbi:hypothetical protein EJ05DRAFT_78037 [Pseudovirgaria hyperparasitica]|uniref:Cora-domain-containing protein n=1 Tax=Pseudovirgaria hyperparasitica TaxID=470096 RepID=A0A6A6W5F1_9PEZI|nr:uncharacterized protein EJ05DRAFT_78037 [Pseudovirgaria hyperparasitica]KAF2756787.1 hypothetical protein EJ05DRAFT_78037 [Pseudovirgaria hyperparasitica]
MPPFHMARSRAADDANDSYPNRRHIGIGDRNQARYVPPPPPPPMVRQSGYGYDEYGVDGRRGNRSAANMWVNTQGDETKITIETCRPQHRSGGNHKYEYDVSLTRERPTIQRVLRPGTWDEGDSPLRRYDDDLSIRESPITRRVRPAWDEPDQVYRQRSRPDRRRTDDDGPASRPTPGQGSEDLERPHSAPASDSPYAGAEPGKTQPYSERIDLPAGASVNGSDVDAPVRVEEPETIEVQRRRDSRRRQVYFSDSDEDASSFNDFRLQGQLGQRDQEKEVDGFDATSRPGVDRPVADPLDRMNITNKEVIYSSFTDSSEDSGELTVALTTRPETARRPSLQNEPLYRWIHLEGTYMDFDAFMDAACGAPEMSSRDKHTMAKVLKRIRRQAEKPLRTTQGNRGRYMVPTLLRECNLSNVKSDGRLDPDQIVTCIALPYFLLKPYTAIELPERSPLHPPRTLMQFLHGSARRERDLQQAVCQIPSTPKGQCFHVAEFWILVLNNSLVVTAANIPQRTVDKQNILLTNKPSDQMSHIVVADSAGSRWQIPKDRSQTWLAFTSHFLSEMISTDPMTRETADSLFKISFRNEQVTAKTWPQTLAAVEHSNASLEISFEGTGYVWRAQLETSELHLPDLDILNKATTDSQTPSQDTAVSISRGDEPEGNTYPDAGVVPRGSNQDLKDTTSKEDKTAHAAQQFQVFSWAVGDRGVSVVSDNNRGDITTSTLGQPLKETTKKFISKIETAMLEVHAYLLSATSAYEKNVYQKATELSWDSISETYYSALKLRDEDNGIAWYMHSAKVIYDFFLPQKVDSILSRKYWGGVWYSINHRRNQISGSDTELRAIVQLMQYINAQLIDGISTSINMPEEFERAFLHIIMYLSVVQADGTRSTIRRAKSHLDKSQSMLKRGWVKLLKSLAGASLSSKAIAGPDTIMSMLVRNLTMDITREHPDLSATYEEYFQQIEFDLQARPLKRSHQGKLTALKQEIEAITKTLDQQRQVLSDLLQAFTSTTRMLGARPERVGGGSGRRGYAGAFPNTHGLHYNSTPGSRDAQIISDALAWVEYRKDQFAEMDARASELEAWNLRQIDSNKDRQEAAIYAFTIVTIIFLPLSFVAGFLGMNTTDVRDMELSQWVFWAAGVPLTVVIILISLLWAGEITNTWDGLKGMWAGVRGVRGESSGGVGGGAVEGFGLDADLISSGADERKDSGIRRRRGLFGSGRPADGGSSWRDGWQKRRRRGYSSESSDRRSQRRVVSRSRSRPRPRARDRDNSREREREGPRNGDSDSD